MSPEWLMDLGLFGWLVLTIFVLAVGPNRGWYYTPGRHQEIVRERDEARAERDALREENARQHGDLVRLTDEFKGMSVGMMGHVVALMSGRKDV